MTTMTHPVGSFGESRHPVLVTTALVVFFWFLAALLVIAANQAIDPISIAGGAAVKVAAILSSAFVYIRLTARTATVDHALVVGIVWLSLGIVAEMTTTALVGHEWLSLIGSPAAPASRDLLLITWIAAPSVFARYSSTDGDLS